MVTSWKSTGRLQPRNSREEMKGTKPLSWVCASLQREVPQIPWDGSHRNSQAGFSELSLTPGLAHPHSLWMRALEREARGGGGNGLIPVDPRFRLSRPLPPYKGSFDTMPGKRIPGAAASVGRKFQRHVWNLLFLGTRIPKRWKSCSQLPELLLRGLQ